MVKQQFFLKKFVCLFFTSFCRMAPEAQMGDNYTEKCDVYSFAIVVWEVFSLQFPFAEFAAVKEMALFRRLREEGLRPTIPESVPAHVRSMIRRCWHSGTLIWRVFFRFQLFRVFRATEKTRLCLLCGNSHFWSRQKASSCCKTFFFFFFILSSFFKLDRNFETRSVPTTFGLNRLFSNQSV